MGLYFRQCMQNLHWIVSVLCVAFHFAVGMWLAYWNLMWKNPRKNTEPLFIVYCHNFLWEAFAFLNVKGKKTPELCLINIRHLKCLYTEKYVVLAFLKSKSKKKQIILHNFFYKHLWREGRARYCQNAVFCTIFVWPKCHFSFIPEALPLRLRWRLPCPRPRGAGCLLAWATARDKRRPKSPRIDGLALVCTSYRRQQGSRVPLRSDGSNVCLSRKAIAVLADAFACFGKTRPESGRERSVLALPSLRPLREPAAPERCD